MKTVSPVITYGWPVRRTLAATLAGGLSITLVTRAARLHSWAVLLNEYTALVPDCRIPALFPSVRLTAPVLPIPACTVPGSELAIEQSWPRIVRPSRHRRAPASIRLSRPLPALLDAMQNGKHAAVRVHPVFRLWSWPHRGTTHTVASISRQVPRAMQSLVGSVLAPPPVPSRASVVWYRVNDQRTDLTKMSTPAHTYCRATSVSGNMACSRYSSAPAVDGMPAMGRIEHRITMPRSVVSVQLQASIPVVCIEPTVLPLDSALTSRSCTLEYVTAATPYPTFIPGNGQVWILALLPSLEPMYIAVTPSVTAYSQSVRPTTTVPLANTALDATRSGIIPLAKGSQRGELPVSASCTIRNAMFAQLSIAIPTLLTPATRKLKNGARSGVHSSRSYSLPPLSAHLSTVAQGITISSWSAELTRLCTPSARFRSSSGYSTRSTGAAISPQKALNSWIPSAKNSRVSPRLESTSNTPFSGYRHAAPSQ